MSLLNASLNASINVSRLTHNITATSIQQVFSYTFLVSIAPIGIMLLFFGIAAARSKNIGYGVVAAFVGLAFMYMIDAALVNITDLAILGTLAGLAIIYELFAHKPKKE
ncbi:MAG: hypothetical protein QXL94_06685 [Candidatus Parvarchaeum sp.]